MVTCTFVAAKQRCVSENTILFHWQCNINPSKELLLTLLTTVHWKKQREEHIKWLVCTGRRCKADVQELGAKRRAAVSMRFISTPQMRHCTGKAE